ncbi:MAG: hypothetical protein ACYTHK_15225 [Planctomycetota bacterium]|jgi:hypothetical protein
MKGALLPTILATAALIGVIVVGMREQEAPSRTVRESAPADPEVGELREKIRRLENRILELENAPQPEPRIVERTGSNPAPAQVPTQPRTGRSSRQLTAMVEAGEIGALTDEQSRKVDSTLRDARTKLLTRLREIRRDPANEDLDREQLTELVQTEFAALRTETIDELSTVVPAADAQAIVEKMLNARSNRRNRGRRNR